MSAGTVNVLTVLNTENALFSAQDSPVQAVAKLHGSTLELFDRHPGLRAVLVLPGALHAPSGGLAEAAVTPSPAPEAAETF